MRAGKVLLLVVVGWLVVSLACLPSVNRPPENPTLTASTDLVAPGGAVYLTIQATDPEGDDLMYNWSSRGGRFDPPDGAETVWTAPGDEGLFILAVEVSDGTSTIRGNVSVNVLAGVAEVPLLTDTPLPGEPTAVPPTAGPTATSPPTATPRPRPTIDPNSRAEGLIVYVCFNGNFDNICTMDANGGNRVQLTDTEATDFYPEFSHDGQQILFSSRRTGNFEAFIMNLDGSNVRQLTNRMGSVFAPAMSPDGSLIAFTLHDNNRQNIWVANADGSNPRQLTDAGVDNVDPTFSPDGTLISFTSDRNGARDLYVMNVDGSNVRQVTFNMNLGGRNDWSPDGQYLSFYAGERPNRNIYIVQADGNGLRALTDGGENLAPSFSPDGQWITFLSYRTRVNEIYRMRVDGSDVVQLTYDSISSWQPRWSPVLP